MHNSLTIGQGLGREPSVLLAWGLGAWFRAAPVEEIIWYAKARFRSTISMIERFTSRLKGYY